MDRTSFTVTVSPRARRGDSVAVSESVFDRDDKRHCSRCSSICVCSRLGWWRPSNVETTMKRKPKRTIPTNREWLEQHREQFERTERHWEEWKLRWERRAAEAKADRGESAAA